VADHVPASSASSATSPPSLNYTDAKPAVDPITEEFLNSLLGAYIVYCCVLPRHVNSRRASVLLKPSKTSEIAPETNKNQAG
jgi:hypothetical protein